MGAKSLPTWNLGRRLCSGTRRASITAAMRVLRADSWGGRGGVKDLLSAGALGLLSMALLLPVIGSCLCPASLRTGILDCCSSKDGFDAAISPDDCCVAPAAQPASAAEASGTHQVPFGAVMVSLTVGGGGVPIIAQSPPKGAPPPGAARPLLNLRI